MQILEIILKIEYTTKKKEGKLYFFNNEKFSEERILSELENHNDEELITKAKETIQEYEDINEIKQAQVIVSEKSYGFIFSDRTINIELNKKKIYYCIKKINIEAWNVSFINKMKRIIDSYFPCRKAAEEEEFKKFIKELKPWTTTRRKNKITITVHSKESEVCKITIEKLED